MAKLFSVRCGQLPVLFFLLLASVPMMASSELGAVLEHSAGSLEKGFEKVVVTFVRKSGLEGAEEFANGLKKGFNICRFLKKSPRVLHPYQQANPGPAGPWPVDTVGFNPTSGASPIMRFPVLTVDLTAAPAARHSLCGVDKDGIGPLRVQQSDISLFGSQGTQRLTPRPFLGTVQLYPAQAHTVAGAPSSSGAVLGLGRGSELSKRYPTFTYQVLADGRAAFWLPTSPQQPGRRLAGGSRSQATTTIPLYTNTEYPRDDGRYYVKVTGIRVGSEVVRTPTELGFRPDGTGGVYLSTTEPYTYLESSVYFRLKAKLVSQIQRLNPGAEPTAQSSSMDKLCYARTELTVPSMAILFAGNAVMKLGAAANVWYSQGMSSVCLAILPTNLSSPGEASVLGSWLQSGRMMTIDVTPGTPGTLTF